MCVMKLRHLLPCTAVATVVAGVSLKPVLRAQPPLAGEAALDPGSDPGPFGGGLAHGMLGRLHLTAEQKKAGLAVLRSRPPAIKPLLDGLTKERTALRSLSKAPAVDESAIRTQAARVSGIEADLAVQLAYLAHDLRALATPAQLQSLDEMQSENASRRARIVQRINTWIADS